MSNQIQTQPGSFVWVCFVGTGSILVAASAHGGICLGNDIDQRVLSGLKKGKKAGSIRQNFAQYNLVQPDLVRMDLSSLPITKRPMSLAFLACDVVSTELRALLPTAFVRERDEPKRLLSLYDSS